MEYFEGKIPVGSSCGFLGLSAMLESSVEVP